MIVVQSPVTGEILGELEVHTAEDVSAATQRARLSQASWAERSVAERVVCMRTVLQTLVSHQDSLIDHLVAETGKVKGDALQELIMVFETFRYYLREAPVLLEPARVATGLLAHKRAKVVRKPRGVVGIIAPWNFPIDLGLGEAVPALLAGNAVMIKPSPLTTLINLKLSDLCRDAGLPDGLLQVVVGDAETGHALCESVDHITFTGSTATGRKVAQVAARRLIPCTLELGGNDAMVVLRDADLARAAEAAAWGGFFNSGQMCMSVERVYVERPALKTFMELLIHRTRSLRQGIDRNYDIDVGSMIHARQVTIVEQHIAEAVERGAIVEIGGRRAEHLGPCFYEPTVLSGVDHDMQVMKEETFGPVIAVMAVEDQEEAIRYANESHYGLNASVWSRDLSLARSVAMRLRTGGVCINDVVLNYGIVDAPFSGVKDSGLGQRHGTRGLLNYTEEQVITEDRLGLRTEMNWYPYSDGRLRRLKSVLGLLGGAWTRLKGARKP